MLLMFFGMPNLIKCKKPGPDAHLMRFPIWRPKWVPKEKHSNVPCNPKFDIDVRSYIQYVCCDAEFNKMYRTGV